MMLGQDLLTSDYFYKLFLFCHYIMNFLRQFSRISLVRSITYDIKKPISIPKFIRLTDFSKMLFLQPNHVASVMCQRDESNFFITV